MYVALNLTILVETKIQKFDVLSFVYSAIAFSGITIGIGNIGTNSLNRVQVYVPLILGISTIILFARRQLRLENPFLNLSILKNNNFRMSLFGSMLLYFIMMGSSIILPLVVQTTLGKSATVSGLVTLPGSLAMTIISPLTGKVYDKFGIKKLFIFGALLLLISNVGMIFIGLESSLIIISVLNVLRSLAIGCLMMPLVTWGMSEIKGELTAHGTALLTSLRTIAGAVGSAVFVSIMMNVADSSIAKFGESAAVHGVSVAFIFMSLFSIILVGISFLSK